MCEGSSDSPKIRPRFIFHNFKGGKEQFSTPFSHATVAPTLTDCTATPFSLIQLWRVGFCHRVARKWVNLVVWDPIHMKNIVLKIVLRIVLRYYFDSGYSLPMVGWTGSGQKSNHCQDYVQASLVQSRFKTGAGLSLFQDDGRPTLFYLI